MSLLLDALKEAELRARPGQAAASDGTGLAAGHAAPSPAGASPALNVTQLTLADDPPPAAATRVAPAAARLAAAAAARHAASPAERQAMPAQDPLAPRTQPARRRPWLNHALLIALPLAAALYWTLFRDGAEPLPALAPPLTGIAPVPAESANAGTPDRASTGVEATAMSGAAAASAFQPAAPRDGGGAARAARAAAAEPQDASATVDGAPATAAAPAAALTTPLLVQRSSSPLIAAHAALRAGDLARAEALYRQMLAGEADQPDARLGMALIEQSRGATAAALAHYRAVLQQRPEDPQAWAGMADLASDPELPPVESRLRFLIASRPDPALHFALGNVLARQSRWPEAQESYFSAVAGAPSNADYAFNLAVALDRLGKARAALPHYARALQLAGDGRAVQFDAAAVRARVGWLEDGAP